MPLNMDDITKDVFQHQEILKAWHDAHELVERPSWDEYFMMLAMLAATRSSDAQSQFGAILVKDQKVVGTGYNSFPRQMPDGILPNTRPLKYKWMIHAEANALYNCVCDTHGAICYVNGKPCLQCLQALYQSGISLYVTLPVQAHMTANYSEEDQAAYDYFVKWANIEIREIQLTSRAFYRLCQIIINYNKSMRTIPNQ